MKFLEETPPKGSSRANPVDAAMPTLIASRSARLICSGTFFFFFTIITRPNRSTTCQVAQFYTLTSKTVARACMRIYSDASVPSTKMWKLSVMRARAEAVMVSHRVSHGLGLGDCSIYMRFGSLMWTPISNMMPRLPLMTLIDAKLVQLEWCYAAGYQRYGIAAQEYSSLGQVSEWRIQTLWVTIKNLPRPHAIHRLTVTLKY